MVPNLDKCPYCDFLLKDTLGWGFKLCVNESLGADKHTFVQTNDVAQALNICGRPRGIIISTSGEEWEAQTSQREEDVNQHIFLIPKEFCGWDKVEQIMEWYWEKVDRLMVMA